MPTISATLTKAQGRQDIAWVTGGYNAYTTSGAGNAGGTTATIAALAGIGPDYVVGKWLLLTSGTYTGQYRRITEFSGSTVTVADAFGGQVATSVTCEIYPYRPALYTQALNRASQALWRTRAIYRVVTSHLITQSAWPSLVKSGVYPMPQNMRDVMRITRLGHLSVRDLFDRADSATSTGDNWTATAGVWGVISERLYSVTDTDGRMLTRDPNVSDGVIQVVLRGTLNSATVYRSPAIMFRIAEDRIGAIDTNNYLLVRLLNGTVQLRKVDGGTESSLTTATQTTTDDTDYQVRVQFIGPRIRVWVDDIELISYALTGLNLKYLTYPRVGIRWDIGGSPATAARVDDYFLFGVKEPYDWTDWMVDPDGQLIRLGTLGIYNPTGILLVEGYDVLSPLAADTTNGTLATDTATTMEIATTDPAYQTFIEQARAELYRLLAGEIYPEGIPLNSQGYLGLAQEAEARVRHMEGMPHSPIRIRHGQW